MVHGAEITVAQANEAVYFYNCRLCGPSKCGVRVNVRKHHSVAIRKEERAKSPKSARLRAVCTPSVALGWMYKLAKCCPTLIPKLQVHLMVASWL